MPEKPEAETALAKLLDRIADQVGFRIGGELNEQGYIFAAQLFERGGIKAGRTERDEGLGPVPRVVAGAQCFEQGPVILALQPDNGVGGNRRLLQAEEVTGQSIFAIENRLAPQEEGGRGR